MSRAYFDAQAMATLNERLKAKMGYRHAPTPSGSGAAYNRSRGMSTRRAFNQGYASGPLRPDYILIDLRRLSKGDVLAGVPGLPELTGPLELTWLQHTRQGISRLKLRSADGSSTRLDLPTNTIGWRVVAGPKMEWARSTFAGAVVKIESYTYRQPDGSQRTEIRAHWLRGTTPQTRTYLKQRGLLK